MNVHSIITDVTLKPHATTPLDHIPVLVMKDLQEMGPFARVQSIIPNNSTHVYQEIRIKYEILS